MSLYQCSTLVVKYLPEILCGGEFSVSNSPIGTEISSISLTSESSNTGGATSGFKDVVSTSSSTSITPDNQLGRAGWYISY